MEGNQLKSVLGWQLTTQQFHRISARLFADCSGDSVLAPITGAHYRMGRESRKEFGESIAPEQEDSHTMGMSCLLQVRECREEHPFVPPPFARSFTAQDLLPYRMPELQRESENFWYLELGGMADTIRDTELLRDELLAAAYGLWDYLKNHPDQREKHRNFALEWVGILPGKRESRRYRGAHVLTQQEVQGGGLFPDVVAYGGWSMDDHHPGGLETAEPPTIYHPAPSPYGIPYRCLYSENIENLFFAGRNISVTHSAMSSTRVMGTCALLGQAVGAAAAVAQRHGTTPHGVYLSHLEELQRILMEEDCWLPGFTRAVSSLTRQAELLSDMADAERLRDGIDRALPIGEERLEDHAASGPLGCFAEYRFSHPVALRQLRLVFDSDLDRTSFSKEQRELNRPMGHNLLLNRQPTRLPATLVRDFRILLTLPDGSTREILIKDFHQRLWRKTLELEVTGVRAEFLSTHGSREVRVFSFDLS